MDEQVASVLERAFPDREVSEVKSTGSSWNDRNRTVGVEFADEPPEELAAWMREEMDRRLAEIE